MNAGNSKPHRCVSSQQDVDNLWQRRRIKHCSYWINVLWLSIDQAEAGRCIHPRVRNDDEHGGSSATEGDHRTGRNMSRRRYAIPAVKINAEEDGFCEKRKAFK